MKRFISVIAVLTILFSCSYLPAYATETKLTENKVNDPFTTTLSNTQTLLAAVAEEPDAYGIDAGSLDKLTLGSQIITYVASNGEIVESEDYTYPLYSDGELIALITSFYVNGTLESMISTAYVKHILESVPDNENYFLVYDCNGVQLVTEAGTQMIDEYAYDSTLSSVASIASEELDSAMGNSVRSSAHTYVDVNFSDNSAIVASVSGSGNATMDVYKYNQGSTSLCWAYSVASIGNTLWGSEEYNGVQVAQALYGTSNYNQGANTTNAMQMLNSLYYYQYGISTTTLSESTAYDFINADYPIYMKYSSTSGGAHAVVLRAINTSSHYFSIMNPGYGIYQGYTNSSGNYAITYNSKTYTLENWGYYYYLY